MGQILFRPTCSKCKKQLFGIIDYEYDIQAISADFIDTALYKRGHVEPNCCPYCNEWFDSIEIPGSIPYENWPDNYPY